MVNDGLIEVQRLLRYPVELGHDAPGKFLQTLRRLAFGLPETEPELAGCVVYDMNFTRDGENVTLRIYYKRPRTMS